MDQDQPRKNSKRTWIAILVIGGSAIITLLLIILSNQKIPFDSNRWRTETSFFEGLELRQKMVDDLQRNVLTYGMTRTEVQSLIGHGSGGLVGEEFDLVYKIENLAGAGSTNRSGSTSHFQGSVRWLVIIFNERDQLSDWRIVTR
ncbi:MAG: hypothetical protein P1U42_01045 [Phycisphaerales bacterium]|nr:hypothetical protein [Phycisphaerales bacterium]